MTRIPLSISTFFISSIFFVACNTTETPKTDATATGAKPAGSKAPAYFNLRPQLEKDSGYSHAVKIGNDLKISSAVTMNDAGLIVARGDMAQQMKNCYSDLEKILQHYGYTYDDVFAENI